MATDMGANQHATWTVSDAGANSSKVWTFGTSGVAQGLATSYEERGPGGTALNHTDYTWDRDVLGVEYLQTVLNTLSPGASQVQSKSVQTMGDYGNLTRLDVYDFGNLTTPAKTYRYTYLADANYTNRGILNRVSQVTLTAGGTTTTLVTNTYDNYTQGCAGAMGLTERTGSGPSWQHDDANFGTGYTYRGNVTYSTSLGGAGCTGYESTGVAVRWEDAAGHFLNAAPSADTSYSLPSSLTPGGNAQLATTVGYTSSWQVTSVTGANGAQGTTTYDPQGRPQKTKIPDGAETNYTYTYVPNTQTATLGSGTGARWKKTTLDGFGRTIRVETGHDSTTVSQVDTQYTACACSPLGKLWRTSAPYAPGGSPQWTTYA
jgi:YD repeat-containing protein